MDLKMFETSSGGDIAFNGNDLEVVSGFQNMIYQALFGGNPGHPTKTFFENEQRFDYWGNNLFYQNQSNLQTNSRTEKLLSEVTLTSASRAEIEETVKKDLKFMNDFAKISVEVVFLEVSVVQIKILVQELSNLEPKEFIYLWDNIKQELSM